MMTDSQKLALSEQLKANMLGDESMRKTAGLAATEYFRTQIRENAVYRQIVPTKPVTSENFDASENTDLPGMIVEIQNESSGAYMVSFETNAKNGVVHGRKARVSFNRIMTDRYEIDKVRVEGYKMDILDVLYDKMLKDIMDVEDITWANVNKGIVGTAANQTAQIAEYGCRRAIQQGALSRAGIAKIKQGILEAPGNLKPAKQLMSELLYSDFFTLDRTAVGGDLAQDTFVNGFTQTKVNGVDTLITSKDEVCGRYDVWSFTDPKFYGGFYTYKDVSMVLDDKDDIWLTFMAHETVGGIVVNRAAVTLTQFNPAAAADDITDWKSE